jgi:hypothetical protein
VDAGDVGVIERRQHLRFALEPGDAFRIVGHRIRQGLDGDLTPEIRVTRAVDLTHATGAKRSDHFVRAKPRSGCEGHRARDYTRAHPDALIW